MEFLFDNPFLIFIIFAILSSLFRGKNQQEEPKQRPTRPRIEIEPERDSQPGPHHFPDIFQKPKVEDRPQSYDMDYERKKKQAEERLTALQQLQRAHHAKAQEYKQVNRQSESRKNAADEERIGHGKQKLILAEKNRLVEGIILSEVLGPPRSRKRHTMIKNK